LYTEERALSDIPGIRLGDTYHPYSEWLGVQISRSTTEKVAFPPLIPSTVELIAVLPQPSFDVIS
jgi:hypothetical protein